MHVPELDVLRERTGSRSKATVRLEWPVTQLGWCGAQQADGAASKGRMDAAKLLASTIDSAHPPDASVSSFSLAFPGRDLLRWAWQVFDGQPRIFVQPSE